MTASLKHNIAAMKETKQLPSFVQVLVTLEEAAAEIERLRMELAAAIGSIRRLVAELDRMKAGQAEEWRTALREAGMLR